MEAKVLSNFHATLRWIGGLHYDMVFPYSFIKQELTEKVHKQIRLTTAADTRHYFYQPIVPTCNEPFQMNVSFYLHSGHFTELFCTNVHFCATKLLFSYYITKQITQKLQNKYLAKTDMTLLSYGFDARRYCSTGRG